MTGGICQGGNLRICRISDGLAAVADGYQSAADDPPNFPPLLLLKIAAADGSEDDEDQGQKGMYIQ